MKQTKDELRARIAELETQLATERADKQLAVENARGKGVHVSKGQPSFWCMCYDGDPCSKKCLKARRKAEKERERAKRLRLHHYSDCGACRREMRLREAGVICDWMDDDIEWMNHLDERPESPSWG